MAILEGERGMSVHYLDTRERICKTCEYEITCNDDPSLKCDNNEDWEPRMEDYS